jgi:hypothetical protein
VPRWHSLIDCQTKSAASGAPVALSQPWPNQTSCICDPVALSQPWPNQTSCIWCLGGILSSMAKPNQLHLATRWHVLMHAKPNQKHLVPRWHSLIHGQTKPVVWCPVGILSSMAKPNQWHLVAQWHSLIYCQTKPAASGDSVVLSHPWQSKTSDLWCLSGTLASTAKPNLLHLVTWSHSLIHGLTKSLSVCFTHVFLW